MNSDVLRDSEIANTFELMCRWLTEITTISQKHNTPCNNQIIQIYTYKHTHTATLHITRINIALPLLQDTFSARQSYSETTNKMQGQVIQYVTFRTLNFDKYQQQKHSNFFILCHYHKCNSSNSSKNIPFRRIAISLIRLTRPVF